MSNVGSRWTHDSTHRTGECRGDTIIGGPLGLDLSNNRSTLRSGQNSLLISHNVDDDAFEIVVWNSGSMQLLLVSDHQVFTSKTSTTQNTQKRSLPGVRALVPFQMFLTNKPTGANGT